MVVCMEAVVEESSLAIAVTGLDAFHVLVWSSVKVCRIVSCM